MKILFIGNTCFRRKIVYHNKMHLHYPSLKKRLAPSSIKSQKNVSATALDYAYVFHNFDKSVLITKIKASILWYHLCYHVWNHIFYVSIFLSSLWIEWTSRNCLSSWIRKYPQAFLQATFFSSTQLPSSLTFHQFIVKYCLGVT